MSERALRYDINAKKKLRTYKVKVSYTFNGTVNVKAESKREAKIIVGTGFGGVNIEVGKSSWTSNEPDESGIVDWEIGMKSDRTHIH